MLDRRTQLLWRSNALAAANNQSLPKGARDRYQKAANNLDVALGLQDAQQRKQQQANPQGLPNELASQLPQGENPPNLLQPSQAQGE